MIQRTTLLHVFTNLLMRQWNISISDYIARITYEFRHVSAKHVHLRMFFQIGDLLLHSVGGANVVGVHSRDPFAIAMLCPFRKRIAKPDIGFKRYDVDLTFRRQLIEICLYVFGHRTVLDDHSLGRSRLLHKDALHAQPQLVKLSVPIHRHQHAIFHTHLNTAANVLNMSLMS